MDATLTTRDGRPALRMARRLDRPPQEVWPALTEADRLSRWYPFRVLVAEPRTGGVFRFDAGRGAGFSAVVDELDPPRSLELRVRTPPTMPREGEGRIRFDLLREGARGTLLVLTHLFDDRYAAAGYAAVWERAVDALAALVDGRPGAGPAPDPVPPELHDAYLTRFGLDAGRVREDTDGWLVCFERQLTRPTAAVWAVLGGSAEGAPPVGAEPPEGFTAPGVVPGPVTACEPPAVLEYLWRDGSGEPAGRVRWRLAPGSRPGARLVLTQCGPAAVPEARDAALAAWRERLAALAARLRG
ncbi:MULTISPECIES: SRPBCC domain-containing protein [Streptomycetaceae]|uniref:Activator of Hsp90 ATPase homologue 1/2-like C-terminal domain-containing protein n=1 Tax=Streptantibioticus cattleyicolor (strain ATCC 35852 / DSM 46488 / JCM 4925 / NBRC 14057 / NRRL 8057) TaxID=1003195 RepID=F8K2R6_STREN|nr:MULTISPECIES: SRPBCC domain-containing protein [Streptomycetaceae]AEW97580.1 hypothetical protein SCATT_52090 [Streptantibioticus cattleyicolor NRRL 8057 = DSM 46488]MYS62012.1 hypothetical protein [Streptomyces sp. SID5468]CCB77905.1 conserved protein of unknown function [Streptantibioticus cattleyicolor NRRL 8057 = DSM 46488]